MDSALRQAHVEEVLKRLRSWLATSGLEGIVFTQPAGVAWVTGGMNPAIDRFSPTDLVWVAVGGDRQAIITTVIERDRVEEDSSPGDYGFELVAVPWFGDSQFVDAAVEFLELPPRALATDGHPIFGVLAGASMVELRLAHTEAAQSVLRLLGRDTARALEAALCAWRPGEQDRAVQARLVAELEQRGAETVVALVSGDARVERFRHPLAAGIPIERLVMGVIVSRRDGLHVAATRIACAGRLDAELARRVALTRQVETAVLEACHVGSTYGTATEALERSYAAVGQPLAWQEHYQGGPIGYATREFEFAPPERASRWWDCPVEVGHALAWNPSLRGGAKVEDTFLVGHEGLECITPPGDWPTEPDVGDRGRIRAAVLELS